MNWENKTLFVGDNLHKMMWPIGWVLSAPNAGAIYVDDLFPQDKNKIKRLLERIGAGDPVYYADFLRSRLKTPLGLLFGLSTGLGVKRFS